MRLPVTLAILAVAATISSACSSSHQPSAGSTTTATSSTSVPPPSSPSTSTTASTVASSTTSTTGPSGPQACSSSQLSGSLASPNGAAGTTYYFLVLRNTGSTTCTLTGYPGVSFLTGQGGSQVGAAADRNPGTANRLQIPAGGSAKAELGITDATNYGAACGITNVGGLQVFPPNQTAAIFVAHQDKACSNKNDVTLHVGPLVTGP